MRAKGERQVRVCVVAPSYPSEAEPYSAFFVRDQAAALRDAGCTVSVVAPRMSSRGGKASDNDSIPVYSFSFASTGKRLAEFKRIPIVPVTTYLASGIAKLLRVARSESCNIIHAHWVVPCGFMAVVAGKYLLRKPVVTTAHGSDIMVFPRANKIRWLLVRSVLKRADHVVAVSRSIQNTIVGEFGIPQAKVSMIRLGVDSDLFKPSDQKEARNRLGLPCDKRIILFVGSLVEVKGLSYLVAAMPEVVGHHANVMFVLIGDGSQKENLQRQARELKVDGYVKFLGPKPHDEIPIWMNAADILVLPSLSEGLPVTLMEARAVGLPAVATDVGGVSEITRDRKEGILIEPGNSDALAEKLNMLLKDRQELESLKSRRHGEESSLDLFKCATEVMSIYETLVEAGAESGDVSVQEGRR